MALAAFVTFGVSMILLYTASGMYHAVKASPKVTLVLRKLDHVMIFFMIAGSYTPFCLLPLRGPWGWSLLGTIWGLALVGAVIKLFWMNAPRWLSTGFYVLMGWLVVVAVYPLVQSVETPSLIWLGVGGLFYTVGARSTASSGPIRCQTVSASTKSGTCSSWPEAAPTSPPSRCCDSRNQSTRERGGWP